MAAEPGTRAGGRAERRTRDAAVLVPVLRRDDGRPALVLVRRATGGIHGGQLAFPGGRREPGDRSLRETALREAREEIGLAEESVEMLTELPAVSTLTSRIRVFPFLARARPQQAWSPCRREIAEVLEVAVAELADPRNHSRTRMSFPSWPGPRLVPYIRVGPHRLWGLTFRIVEPLLPRLLAEEWPL